MKLPAVDNDRTPELEVSELQKVFCNVVAAVSRLLWDLLAANECSLRHTAVHLLCIDNLDGAVLNVEEYLTPVHPRFLVVALGDLQNDREWLVGKAKLRQTHQKFDFFAPHHTQTTPWRPLASLPCPLTSSSK